MAESAKLLHSSAMDLWNRLWGRYHVPQNVFVVLKTFDIVNLMQVHPPTELQRPRSHRTNQASDKFADRHDYSDDKFGDTLMAGAAIANMGRQAIGNAARTVLSRMVIFDPTATQELLTVMLTRTGPTRTRTRTRIRATRTRTRTGPTRTRTRTWPTRTRSKKEVKHNTRFFKTVSLNVFKKHWNTK